MTPTCTISDCRTPARCRGWCDTHYTRFRRHGDPTVGPRPTAERFRAKWVIDGECWHWIGLLDAEGYGKLYLSARDGGPTTLMAHRYAYVTARGEVPEGLELDHLCNHRWCVNPDHLEAVTHAENIRRAIERRV